MKTPALDPKYRWYKVVLSDLRLQPREYIFRGLTGHEERVMMDKPDVSDQIFEVGGMPTVASPRHLYALERCVVGDHDWSVVPFGTYDVLWRAIYRVSGRTKDHSPVSEALKWLSEAHGILEAAAMAMIPGLTLTELNTCDPADRAKYLLVGKIMFEALYDTPVTEAFSGLTDPQARARQRAQPGRESFSHLAPTPIIPGQTGAQQKTNDLFGWDRAAEGPSTPLAPEEIPDNWAADRSVYNPDRIGLK